MAQTISVEGFGRDTTGNSSGRILSSYFDQSGIQCAQIRIKTLHKGWTFEAGGAWIENVRQEQNAVILYVSSSARELSFSHPNYGLLNWPITQTLEPGGTYTMTLKAGTVSEPRRVKVNQNQRIYESVQKTSVSSSSSSAASAVSPQSSSVAQSKSSASSRPSSTASRPEKVPESVSASKSSRKFCNQFIDVYYARSYETYEYDNFVDSFLGLQYTILPDKVGLYASLAFSFDDGWSAFAGAAFRLFPETTSRLDLQLYGGVGLVYEENVAGEVGIRFAWKGSHDVSRCDFGFGCQVWQNTLTPTVSIGFSLWGIPLLVTLGVCAVSMM